MLFVSPAAHPIPPWDEKRMNYSGENAFSFLGDICEGPGTSKKAADILQGLVRQIMLCSGVYLNILEVI